MRAKVLGRTMRPTWLKRKQSDITDDSAPSSDADVEKPPDSSIDIGNEDNDTSECIPNTPALRHWNGGKSINIALLLMWILHLHHIHPATIIAQLIIDNPNEPKEYLLQDASAVCDPRNFLVLIKAGAKSKYQERRKFWRNSSCPMSYKYNLMKYHFMLAMPAHKIIDPNSHNQGARANDNEIHDMGRLQHESLANNDMEFLPIKDVYDDSNLKVISMLRWAVDGGMNENTSMVVIHDDEYCLQPQVLQDICVNATQSNSSLYAGWHLWKTPSYKIQKAFDGSFSPYFSGGLYALSSDLVRGIAHDPDTLFKSINVGMQKMCKWEHG